MEIPFDWGWILRGPTMRRQSDTRSGDWAERYAAEAATAAEAAS